MNSPIKWVGGKRNLRKEIVALMPEHTQYVEVFAGALWVMLEKEPSKLEIFNDINGDLVNFYLTIQDEEKLEKLINELYFLPKSRELFEEFDKKIKESDELDDVKRATMFYYLLKLCFGGRYDRAKKPFCVPNDGRKSINYDKFPDEFYLLHERIKNAFIERADYTYILDKYDREDGLFFLDPPYLNTTEKNYGVVFDLGEYKRLVERLAELKGKFILTCNDTPELRELFSGFHIVTKDVNYSVNSKKRRPFKELIVTNYEIDVVAED